MLLDKNIDKFDLENSELLNAILNRTFFSGYKLYNPLEEKNSEKYANYKEVEFIINGKCDLKCKYCYITKFGKEIYPHELHKDNKKILKNAEILLEYFKKNGYKPNNFSLFSGEPLMQKIGLDILELVIDFCSEYHGCITIPTNYNFVHFDKFRNRVLFLIDKAKKNKVDVNLSASIDGLYCDKNRPSKINLTRDYDKIFSTAKMLNSSFHPMIYCEEIEYWKDNFLWFQEMFKKYNIFWASLYLLEVRNVEWKPKQIKKYGEFISFITKWIFEKSGCTPENFIEWIIKVKPMNIFSSFSTAGRGMGCSIQSTMQIRLADLSVFPCHRLTYPYFKLYEFIKNNDNKIEEIFGINPELLTAIQASNHKNFPLCEACLIKELCGGQCLGSMYEVTGDLFTPIPIVCQLEHVKIASLVNTLYELNVFPNYTNHIQINKKESIILIHNMLEKNRGN